MASAPGYDCSSCGSSMTDLRRRQPDLMASTCWCCYAEALERDLRVLRVRRVAAISGWVSFIGAIVGILAAKAGW